jgi:CHASE2 domain-containing sensor protein
MRQVPLAVDVKNRPKGEESFAGAIARIQAENVVAEAEQYKDRGFPYGSFYRRQDFTTVTAGFALENNNLEKLKEKVQGKIVIVGGGWHSQYFRGPTDDSEDSVDIYFTPADLIQGAYVQANYVEALLSGSVRERLPDYVGTIIEILCALLVAVVFALEGSLRKKFFRVLNLCVVLIILSYVLWQNLGIFFDFFIPIVLLSIHAPIEQLRETRVELHHLRERLHAFEQTTADPAPSPR